MNENVFLGLFPFIFVGMWLLICWVLGQRSGWFRLAERFPDRLGRPLDTMRLQSAAFGKSMIGAVNFGNCLTFGVMPDGLRVSVWKVFGPFSKPFLVPWGEITAREKKFLFVRRVELSLGREGGEPLAVMAIRPRSFKRIAANSPLRLVV